MTDLIRRIDRNCWPPARNDAAQIGGKAIGLAALQHAGLRTPEALVLTAEAYWGHLHKNTELANAITGWDASPGSTTAIRRAFQSTDIDGRLMSSIRTAVADWGDRFAVRSSAIVEDSSEASWAGQFESRLGVSTVGLEQAILHVWQSLFSVWTADYAQTTVHDLRRTAMAVIIQRMVYGQLSGVAFSGIDERRNSRPQHLIIEYVTGLGEQLVSGRRQPTAALSVNMTTLAVELLTLRDDRGEPDTRPGATSGLSAGELKELVAGVTRMQQLYRRTTLDFEFTLHKSLLYFLQVRPLVTPSLR